jgi:hypothetical protein
MRNEEKYRKQGGIETKKKWKLGGKEEKVI